MAFLNFYGFTLEKKYFKIDIERKKILQIPYTNETDLCTNCWKHKAVLTNVTYEYFDGSFKFGPVCVDCFDIDEFNKSTSIYLGHQQDYNNPPLDFINICNI